MLSDIRLLSGSGGCVLVVQLYIPHIRSTVYSSLSFHEIVKLAVTGGHLSFKCTEGGMGDGVFSGGGNSGSNLNPLGKFDTLHQVTLTFETKKATHYSKRSCQQPNEKTDDYQQSIQTLYVHFRLGRVKYPLPHPPPLGLHTTICASNSFSDFFIILSSLPESGIHKFSSV